MSLGALEEFTADEQALIPAFNPADEPQATATDDAAHGVDKDAQQSTQPQTDEPQQETTAQAPAAPAQAEQPTEDSATRRALRAARRGEAQALQQAERLKAELEELRKQVPTGQADGDAIDDAEIEQIAADVPVVAKLARKLKALEQALPAARQAAATQPEFTPVRLPVEVQDNVDANPTLLAWQHDPDQSRFQAAVAMDAYLQSQPAWANRPMSERFAEVARRVAADHGVAPASQTQPDPIAAIRRAPIARPNTLSDVPGSGGHQPNTSTLERFVAAKSDDEILATLDRMG